MAAQHRRAFRGNGLLTRRHRRVRPRRGGRWSSLNPATLSVPGGYRLIDAAETVFGVRATALNDAQAAAWGEYRWGAGERADMVFLTISTGVGGGVVLNGTLLRGLSGHFGLWSRANERPLEAQISGRWLASQAATAGFSMSAKEIFAAASGGEDWAKKAIAVSAERVAALCTDIQLAFDPRHIVIGGGIGLAAGYIDMVTGHLSRLPDRLRPVVVPARLGARAGLVGIADLAG